MQNDITPDFDPTNVIVANSSEDPIPSATGSELSYGEQIRQLKNAIALARAGVVSQSLARELARVFAAQAKYRRENKQRHFSPKSQKRDARRRQRKARANNR